MPSHKGSAVLPLSSSGSSGVTESVGAVAFMATSTKPWRSWSKNQYEPMIKVLPPSVYQPWIILNPEISFLHMHEGFTSTTSQRNLPAASKTWQALPHWPFLQYSNSKNNPMHTDFHRLLQFLLIVFWQPELNALPVPTGVCVYVWVVLSQSVNLRWPKSVYRFFI